MAKLGRHAWPKSAERALSTGQGRAMKRGSRPARTGGGSAESSLVQTDDHAVQRLRRCPKMYAMYYTPLPDNRNKPITTKPRYRSIRSVGAAARRTPRPSRRAAPDVRQRTRRDGAIRRGVPPLARVPPRNKEDHADAPARPAWESTVRKQGSRRLQVQLEVDPAALRLDRHTHHRNHNGMPRGAASQFPRGSWLYSRRSPGLLRGHRLDRTGQQP